MDRTKENHFTTPVKVSGQTGEFKGFVIQKSDIKKFCNCKL
jgi:hypothetical protein